MQNGSQTSDLLQNIVNHIREMGGFIMRRWVRISLVAVIAIVVVSPLVMVWLGWSVDLPPWLGFGPYEPPPGTVEGYEPPKTLWSLLDLVVVPVVLVATAYLFSQLEGAKRLEIERERQREEAMQAYLDRISRLAFENNLVDSGPGDKARDIVRMLTLTTMGRLDGKRKGVLMQFLREAGLIQRGEPTPDDRRAPLPERKAVISLETADLRNIDLDGALMNEVDLIRANLEGAKLCNARLSQADLFDAVLRKADLRNANLKGADLRGVDFTDADLRDADLSSSMQDSRTIFARAKTKGAKGVKEKSPLGG